MQGSANCLLRKTWTDRVTIHHFAPLDTEYDLGKPGRSQ